VEEATTEIQTRRTSVTSTTVRTAAAVGLTASQKTIGNHSNRKDFNNSEDTIRENVVFVIEIFERFVKEH
jgi:hypothetical protein